MNKKKILKKCNQHEWLKVWSNYAKWVQKTNKYSIMCALRDKDFSCRELIKQWTLYDNLTGEIQNVE